jgi:LPXTG-motif cell wall-anchored protein
MRGSVNRAATALRRSFAVEAIVATAILLTLLAAQFRDAISADHHIAGTQLWYAAIGGCWLLLIAGILLFRRRQMASLRKASEDALRSSE